MGTKKSVAKKNGAADTNEEPVMVWSITAKGHDLIEVVGTEDDAEKIRAKAESDGMKGAKKKPTRTLESGALFDRYQESGAFLIGDDDELVKIWSISCAPRDDYEFVATETEAETERANVERDVRAEGHKEAIATKTAVRAAQGATLAHYEKYGSYLIGEEREEREDDETFSEAEEKLACEVIVKLRASDKPLTVAELHQETNEEDKEGYVPAGQIDKVLKKMLVPRGLAALDGEAFVAVAPGVLAQRRGEMLASYVSFAVQENDEWGDAIRAYEEAFTAEQHADAAALADAGLLKVDEDAPAERGHDPGYSCVDERAKEILTRGAIALVTDMMPECRESGAAVVVDGDPAKALAKAESLLKQTDAKLERAVKEREDARKGLAAKADQVDVLVAWFKKNNLPSPLDKPEVPKPPREEFTHTITPTAADKGRMYGIRVKVMARLTDVDATLAAAKATHKTHSEMLNTRLKSLDDAVTGLFYDAPAFRRVDLQRGVAQIVHVEDESWVLDEKELRSEQIEAEKAKAEEAVKPAAAPGDGDTMQIIPPGADGGSEVASTLGAAVASPGFAEKLADKLGVPVRVDASGAVPVITVSDKPPPPTPEEIGKHLVQIVAVIAPNDTLSLSDVAVRLARPVFGVEPGDHFGKLVKKAAREQHKVGTIHWEARDGGEWISAPRTKDGAKNSASAAAPGEPDMIEKVLGVIRASGAKGMAPGDVEGPGVEAAVETLKGRGAIVHNGKRGRGARLLAKEFAPSDASAGASA